VPILRAPAQVTNQSYRDILIILIQRILIAIMPSLSPINDTLGIPRNMAGQATTFYVDYIPAPIDGKIRRLARPRLRAKGKTLNRRLPILRKEMPVSLPHRGALMPHPLIDYPLVDPGSREIAGKRVSVAMKTDFE
jgi:hypothetical protein